MKFIHCSDLHLDSKMKANLSPAQARERNAEILTTFSHMADYAKKQGARAVLIAGDLFDSERVTSVTVDYILNVIRQSENMDFLYLKGNHDIKMRFSPSRTLPKNLKTFSSDRWTAYDYGSVAVTGAEITDDNAFDIYDSLFLDPAKTNIVMLHGEVAGRRGRDLVSLPDLRGKHIDYLALGHWHASECGSLDSGGGNWCYSGVFEGRGFDECGRKGFIVLDADDHFVRHEFIPFAKRTFFDVPVDITGLATVTEISAAMKAASLGIPPKDLVKFTLQGSYTLETQKDLPFLLKLMENRFYFVRIRDESRLLIDRGSYEHDISLKGEFIRTVMDSDLSDEDKDKIICLGIRALSGEEIEI